MTTPAAVLAWAVHTGAALALRPSGGVALLAPVVLGVPRALEVPAPVRAALAADWRLLRALLADTRTELAAAGMPGAPAALDGDAGAPVLTVATRTTVVRLTLATDAERAAWRRVARTEHAREAPAWLAAVAASEVLAGPASPCPAVRARHLAAVRAAFGTAPGPARAA